MNTRRSLNFVSTAFLVIHSSFSLCGLNAEDLDHAVRILDSNTLEDFDFGIPFLKKLGEDDAPLVLLEFSDYQCDHCSLFHEIVFPKIKSEFIDTGKLYYVVLNHPQPGHSVAEKAAIIAYCAGEQGKFWEMRDLLFADSLYLNETRLTGLVEYIGLPEETMKDCEQSGVYSGLIAAEKRSGSRAGVEITPSFILAEKHGDRAVNGQLEAGVIMWSEFKKLVNEKLRTMAERN